MAKRGPKRDAFRSKVYDVLKQHGAGVWIGASEIAQLAGVRLSTVFDYFSNNPGKMEKRIVERLGNYRDTQRRHKKVEFRLAAAVTPVPVTQIKHFCKQCGRIAGEQHRPNCQFQGEVGGILRG